MRKKCLEDFPTELYKRGLLEHNYSAKMSDIQTGGTILCMLQTRKTLVHRPSVLFANGTRHINLLLDWIQDGHESTTFFANFR